MQRPFLLAVLTLTALAGIAGTTHAATPATSSSVATLNVELEEELELEEEVVEEECEEVEAGVEECEEVEDADLVRGEECVLRTARAHAALDRTGKKLKLTIGYTAYAPAKAKVEIGQIATLHRNLGRSGVLRFTKNLGATKSGKRLVVTIAIPSARNAGCPFRRLVLVPR